MIDFSDDVVNSQREIFRRNGYVFVSESIHGRDIEYFILPQSLNTDLPDFVYRVTNDETKKYVMGVCESVPDCLRKYFVLAEYIEFIEKGLAKSGRVVEAEKETLGYIPAELKKEYLQRRLNLFSTELELDEQQPDFYCLGEARKEFEQNIEFIKKELEAL